MRHRILVPVLFFVSFGLIAQGVFAQWQPTNATDTDPITHSGNVAIGTSTPPTDPLYPLKVFGSGAQKGIRIQTTSDHPAFFETSSNGACTARLQSDSASGWAGTVTNHPFLFLVNSAERARIQPGGYFALGTTSPISSLHQYSNSANNPTTAAISGTSLDGLLTLNAGSLGVGGGGGGILFGGNGSSQYFAAVKSLLTNGSGNTTGDLAFSTRASTADSALTERLRLTSEGKLGLGTASPMSSLHQYSNSANNPIT